MQSSLILYPAVDIVVSVLQRIKELSTAATRCGHCDGLKHAVLDPLEQCEFVSKYTAGGLDVPPQCFLMTCEGAKALIAAGLVSASWRQYEYLPPKRRWTCTELRGITSHKIVLFVATAAAAAAACVVALSSCCDEIYNVIAQ
jgi:hypothetical protein